LKRNALDSGAANSHAPLSATNDFKGRFTKGRRTAKLAVTMAKVRIRQAVAQKPWPRWHLIDFYGRQGRESRGVVDIIAIRKDHSKRSVRLGIKRGDALQIILVQVKGGAAANPTPEDAKRLLTVAKRHGASAVLLGSWKSGKAVKFYSLGSKTGWTEVTDLSTIFIV
jgi:hypothetical protein